MCVRNVSKHGLKGKRFFAKKASKSRVLFLLSEKQYAPADYESTRRDSLSFCSEISVAICGVQCKTRPKVYFLNPQDLADFC